MGGPSGTRPAARLARLPQAAASLLTMDTRVKRAAKSGAAEVLVGPLAAVFCAGAVARCRTASVAVPYISFRARSRCRSAVWPVPSPLQIGPLLTGTTDLLFGSLVVKALFGCLYMQPGGQEFS